jgi:hypothetical protein
VQCGRGHPWSPGHVIVSYVPCSCRADEGISGYTLVWCTTDVGLDCQELFHDAERVVDDAAEGAVGEENHAYLVEPAVGLEVEQGLSIAGMGTAP